MKIVFYLEWPACSFLGLKISPLCAILSQVMRHRLPTTSLFIDVFCKGHRYI